jgi:riboflavin biosynthesis pyrimidine reductase
MAPPQTLQLQTVKIQTLIDRDPAPSPPVLPSELRDLYAGDLHFPAPSAARPYVIANFVSTLDGVVSYGIEGNSSGSAISGSDPADRFIMGLLRASADAIIVGSRTLQDAGPKSLWTPEFTYPDAKRLFAGYRAASHKPEYPRLIVVSGSGRLELDRAVFQTPAMPAIVITTPAGKDELARRGSASLNSLQVFALDSSDGSIPPAAILQLFGQILAAAAIDELFLTLSPQIAGRNNKTSTRPALVEAVEFMPPSAPWFQLLSVKQRAAQLYLRYRRP